MVIARKGVSFHLGVSKTKDFTPTVHIKLKHHNMFIFCDQGGGRKRKGAIFLRKRSMSPSSRAMPINTEKNNLGKDPIFSPKAQQLYEQSVKTQKTY